MFVASKTLVVYAPYAQRLNSRCRSSLCSQMQSGRLLLTDECRTILPVCTLPVRCFYLHTSSTGPSLSSVFFAVSMSTVVVLSMLPLPCVVDGLGLVDVYVCLELCGVSCLRRCPHFSLRSAHFRLVLLGLFLFYSSR
jgi:hypothetical protein